MIKITMNQVPWGLMIIENNCKNCERLDNCTYKDLFECFISNVDEVLKTTKEEVEENDQD